MWHEKKGQLWAYGLMLSLTIIVLALALAPIGKSFVDSSMNVTVGDTIGLDCSNSSISNFDKGACVVTDFSQFYFFGGLILLAGAIALGRIILE